jgi:uncharacterized membrane protein YphA (DoxX/SURF4 family)
MKNQKNINLFWYGFKAGLIKIAGSLLLLCGLVFIFFNIIVAIILIILGFFLILKGRSQRFDYQRQSGSIVHRGDW